MDILRLTPSGYLYFSDGTWQNTAGVTGVTPGGGLTVSVATGDITINVDPAVIQKRVTAACSVSSAMTSIDQTGGLVDCQSFVDLTTTQSIGGSKTFTGPIISTVSSGTAPLAVSSQTMVINLNSEMVGGMKVADL
ncbi:MAG TPA: hypothetical protein VMB78_08235, partial [Dissulfurispiraceae bacterium]|nr:hypothetical protein [Dissulfurispiraceae bacterium]